MYLVGKNLTKRKVIIMSELEIPNKIRKRASMGAIRESGESCKRVRYKDPTHDKMAKVRERVEKKSRQRVRLLSCEQNYCRCSLKVVFCTCGCCNLCQHVRCAECMILESTSA